jgi:large subunit ribosomal protein L6
MSNLAKQLIKIPLGTAIKKNKSFLVVEGPFGHTYTSCLTNLVLTPTNIGLNRQFRSIFKKDIRFLKAKAIQGLSVASVRQALVCLSSGFTVKLILVGVGYRVLVELEDSLCSLDFEDSCYDFFTTSQSLKFKLGYSHEVFIEVPPFVRVKSTKNTAFSVFGWDKQKVQNFAANIRSYKKPEPYKGKGILYQDETVILKEGKRS